MKYDPIAGPDPDAWLELDESERVEAVQRHHKRAGVQVGSLRGHAIIHSVVEAQLAEGLKSAVGALERLQEEGLDRHDAIHAIGSVLRRQLYEAATGDAEFDPESYDEELGSLTAAAWLALGQDS